MSVLTRYLLRAHLGPFLYSLLALTGLMILNTVARELAVLQGRGIPTRTVLEFFLLSLPPVVALTLPMSVLVAVLYAFSQMAAEREIVALQASGVDVRRAALPVLAAAAVVAGAMLCFHDRVLPATNQRLYLLSVDIARTSPLLAFRERAVNAIPTPRGSAYLSAARIDVATGRMHDVTLVDPREPQVTRTIRADSGRVSLDAGGTDLVLLLHDGHLRRLDFRQPADFERIGFRRYLMRLPGVAQGVERTAQGERVDRSMTIAMLRQRIEGLRPRASGPGPDAETARWQIRALQVELHKKFSISAAALIFVLVGIPLALRFPAGGIALVIALSLPIFTIYYIGLDGGEALADAGHLSPVVAMWGVNGLMAAAGAAAFARLGRGFGWRRH